jgi:hypothetical protein
MTTKTDMHLRTLVERMVREGASEREIHQAVREASGETRPERRPSRLRLRRRRY